MADNKKKVDKGLLADIVSGQEVSDGLEHQSMDMAPHISFDSQESYPGQSEIPGSQSGAPSDEGENMNA